MSTANILEFVAAIFAIGLGLYGAIMFMRDRKNWRMGALIVVLVAALLVVAWRISIASTPMITSTTAYQTNHPGASCNAGDARWSSASTTNSSDHDFTKNIGVSCADSGTALALPQDTTASLRFSVPNASSPQFPAAYTVSASFLIPQTTDAANTVCASLYVLSNGDARYQAEVCETQLLYKFVAIRSDTLDTGTALDVETISGSTPRKDYVTVKAVVSSNTVSFQLNDGEPVSAQRTSSFSSTDSVGVSAWNNGVEQSQTVTVKDFHYSAA